MKKRHALAMLMLGLAACAEEVDSTAGSGALPGDDETDQTYVPPAETGKADGFSPPNGPLVFDGACQPGDRITIAAVGDVLLHARLQQQAFASQDRYRSLWSGVEDLLAAADVTYANLEGPTAAGVDARGRNTSDPGARYDDRVYTSYPMFNYHPSLIDDLKASGVDVVSTANNHSLDRWALGVDRTIDALEAAGMPFTGTRRAGDRAQPWHTLTRSNGITLAWVACTYGTNGLPDRADQVLFCFEDRESVLAEVKALSARGDVDAVIVTPHWGVEYDANPSRQQVKLAHELLDAGATAVIGSHPHVLQPWERYVTADGRETFVIYSLGNFVSGQTHLPRRSTLLLYLGLTRTPEGKVVINGARYVPLHMTTKPGGRLTLEAIDRVGGLADSRKLTVGMFRAYNVQPPDEPLVTDPQCDPAWVPPPTPHPHDGWIGGACATDATCGGAICLDNLPGGLCTERCERVCPDRAGRAITFCADLGYDDGGVCVARCTRDADCREGYACLEAERHTQPEIRQRVCIPTR